MENLVVEKMGLLSEKKYDGLKKGSRFALKDSEKQTLYKVIDIRDKSSSSGFQGMLVEELKKNGLGSGKYIFSFKGEEQDAMGDDLLVGDIACMGSGSVPQQMEDAMEFVHEMIEEHRLSPEDTAFTGHSMGSAIAGMAGCIYGFDAYTY